MMVEDHREERRWLDARHRHGNQPSVASVATLATGSRE
jgi:hypothetical protein